MYAEGMKRKGKPAKGAKGECTQKGWRGIGSLQKGLKAVYAKRVEKKGEPVKGVERGVRERG